MNPASLLSRELGRFPTVAEAVERDFQDIFGKPDPIDSPPPVSAESIAVLRENVARLKRMALQGDA